MKKGLLFILVGLVCGGLIMSCAPKYVHKEDPTFSFTYPKTHVYDKLRFDTEVARVKNTENAYGLPNYVAAVYDKPSYLKLSGAGKFIVKRIQTSYPAASRFKILDQKQIKLSDGSDALEIQLKWKWIDKVTTLKSAGVIGIKGDKVISLIGTTIFSGGSSMETLMEVCRTLKLE